MVGIERNTIGSFALCLAVAAAASPAGAQTFSDQTSAAGLSHTTSLPLGMSQRQMFCGGSVGDFDQDGWPDIFLLGGGDNSTADALYMNNGDGTFTDEAASWGVALAHQGRGSTVGDFNSDGWPDIYVTSGGDMGGGDRPGQHKLYRNNGNETFTDIAATAGVNQTSVNDTTATGAAFGDFDKDGDLDLFVCGWEGLDGNRLFENDGDETFTDVTLTAGVGYNYFGFSPRFVDMDGDRWPELLIASDYGTSQYYVNDQDGTFTRLTANGTGEEDNGMGSLIADFNRDGLPDWYVTSIYNDSTNQDGNYLYINQGNHQFTVLPEVSGARDGGWGWGVEGIDFDHDGFIDIVETNGWPPPEWEFENSYLFRNNGDMTFTEAQGGSSGFNHVTQGRSLVRFDYDRDGDQDILLTGWDEPVALYRNDVSTGNWIEVFLDTSAEETLAPDGYGSRVIATTGGVSQYQWIDGGATYLGRSECAAQFGLDDATTVDLTVEWANGTDTALVGVPVNQIITISPTIAGAPGEASSDTDPADQMRAAYNSTSGRIDVNYTPSCNASDHTIYYGSLADVETYAYSGAACWQGVSGTASLDPGPGNAFFLIVGNTGSVEGSYGQDGVGAERPEDLGTAGCDLPRDLSGTCE